ncbi:unnamed protein product [Lymnaea stagnalis]|uniref:Temptin n=1 Tax=Lymnaea stagnalis TaxID=6523 RepID=A0AAV2HJ10_LYMST
MLHGLWLTVSLLHCVASFKSYQFNIPNGGAVPHPCKPNHIWQGVGHFIDEGTGHRNPFGADFETAGNAWTAALCQRDSDGDGLTNGQELGDPNCVWKEGAVPNRTASLSHPGICDPWDSPICFSKNVTSPKYRTQEDWMREMCKPNEFVCAGLNESDVRNLSLRLPNGSRIPAKETTYMCQIFDFENMTTPGDYHLIAVEPQIDNSYAIHHIVLFGCQDSAVPSATPFECEMLASPKCQDFLNVWTVGLPGECYHPKTGIRIGTNGYKRMAVQLPWNNPQVKSDWTDNSGLLLHYTPNRRQHDAAIFVTGLQNFVLPPGRQSLQVKGTCTSECTRMLVTSPAWVTTAWNHMHYAGRKMSIQLIRNNTPVTFLSNDAMYSYDNPQVSYYNDNPVQMLPGDELITTCEYSTLRRTKYTRWGEATSDEMCFGFLTFYPKKSIRDLFCVALGPDISYCDPTTFRGCRELFYFYNKDWVSASSLYNDLKRACVPFSPCLDECMQTILKHRKENPCLQDDEVFTFLKSEVLSSHETGVRLLSLMASCDVQVYRALSPGPVANETTQAEKGSNPASLTTSGSLLILLVTSLAMRFGGFQ